ncbi:hypothetical protein ACYOEI_08960 [Singulisphaera rosea]
MNHEPAPIERYRFEIQPLVDEFPPVLNDRNKQVVYAVASPPGARLEGWLESSRWTPLPWPERVDSAAAEANFAARPGFFDYRHEEDMPNSTEWHVNFADPRLFFAYGSGLFAQDEMQVAEHPVLGSLREALVARNYHAVTLEGNQPTPVLVMGVPRQCRVATDVNVAEGRPRGLYGNLFARAEPNAVRNATTRIDPPTITNLIAIAAPVGRSGRYRLGDLEFILDTAFTGFRAAVLESRRVRGEAGPVVIHTGFWGCGAFGGNRVVMVMLQAIASAMAGVDRIVIHTGDPSGNAAIRESRGLFDSIQAGGSTFEVRAMLQRIDANGFEWGVSDGN